MKTDPETLQLDLSILNEPLSGPQVTVGKMPNPKNFLGNSSCL